MSMIKKFCQKCKEEIFNSGFYLSLTQRNNRSNRDNCFLCDDCQKELIEFIDENKIGIQKIHTNEDKN